MINLETYNTMKNFKFLATLFALFSALTLMSCESGKNQESTTADSQNGFSPNPQEIEEREVPKLAIGDKAPYFNLPDVDGKYISLDQFKDHDALVINFTCNHCPTAQAYEERFMDVVTDYEGMNVAFLAISPNSPIGILPEELGYTDLNDDYHSMQVRHKDMNYNHPYLYDGDTHEYSLAYGPTATPHVFVFDKDKKLTYSGRIDASEKPGTANAEDLRKAIDQTLDGQPVAAGITPAFGCSTKWAWKNEFAVKTNKEWKEKPVTVEKLSPEGLQDLLNNESDELLLVNFWATWCGPCIVEYPEFIEIHRMYSGRDFRFASISMDNPNQEEKVLKFLKGKFSAVDNYLLESEDKYAAINIVKNDWDGSLPLTLLIEPGGKVAHKVPGEINVLALRRAIVDHPMIGRYY